MVTSGQCLLGNHWNDWLATDCPALIIRGRDSRVTTESEFEQMATRRPNTGLETLNGSHVLHFEDPAAFEAATKNFLETL
jgi:esterase